MMIVRVAVAVVQALSAQSFVSDGRREPTGDASRQLALVVERADYRGNAFDHETPDENQGKREDAANRPDPGDVRVKAIDRKAEQGALHRLELRGGARQRNEFAGTYRRKISRVREEDEPAASILVETYLAQGRSRPKQRRGVSNPERPRRANAGSFSRFCSHARSFGASAH